jgi:hypothetical protein
MQDEVDYVDLGLPVAVSFNRTSMKLKIKSLRGAEGRLNFSDDDGSDSYDSEEEDEESNVTIRLGDIRNAEAARR